MDHSLFFSLSFTCPLGFLPLKPTATLTIIPRPQQCNFKLLSRVLSQVRNLRSSAHLKHSNITTGFYKTLEHSLPFHFLKIMHNIKQRINWRWSQLGTPNFSLTRCNQVVHLLGFCGVNWFASTSSALPVTYHSSTGFPSSKNVLTSFVLSSSLLVMLKHLFFLNPLLISTALLKLYFLHIPHNSLS